jgi:hypothetical protein
MVAAGDGVAGTGGGATFVGLVVGFAAGVGDGADVLVRSRSTS